MVRLKRSDPPPVGRRPKRMNSCDLTLNFSIYFLKYFSISRSEKASFPAGTGVWVVKIVLLLTASNASAYVSPSSRVNLITGQILYRSERHVSKIISLIDRLLFTTLVDLLPEISLPVEQADSYKRKTKVTCSLAVVPGKDAEAA